MKLLAHNLSDEKTFDQLGECALPFAPEVQMADGSEAIPQQFIEVRRCLESTENILADIQVPKGFLLFAGQMNSIVFLQAGVIGYENYPKKAGNSDVEDQKSTECKIVYGRRWLLEPATPTSEVVQTAFLAVKKAREHELREYVYLSSSEEGNGKYRRTTPFNTHLDMPLMVRHKTNLYAANKSLLSADEVEKLLARISVDGYQIELVNMAALHDDHVAFQLKFTLLDEVIGRRNMFSELRDQMISFVCKALENVFLHELFAAILKTSDDFIAQNFTYRGLPRFAIDISVDKVAEFSFLTRNPRYQDSRFDHFFEDMSYEVDSAKAPTINQGALGERQKKVLAAYDGLQGYLPIGI